MCNEEVHLGDYTATDNEACKLVDIAASGQLIGAGALVGRTELTVVPAYELTLKTHLFSDISGLRSGYIQVPNRAFVVMEGRRHEITVDLSAG